MHTELVFDILCNFAVQMHQFFMMFECVQTVASLNQLFHIGKLVRCRIISITTRRSKKVVSLTINPKDVNKDVKPVKSGMVSHNRFTTRCRVYFCLI